MNPDLQRELMAALERPHRLGTIGGDLEEQLAHCASFSSVLDQVTPPELATKHRGTGIDLGTGGGLPGVALAALWPAMAWTLVDVRTARADEVERTVLRLGMADRVTVVAAEAQLLGHDKDTREQFDIAVARAFGPPSVTAECAAGVVTPGGVFVVSEPPTVTSDDERWDPAGLAQLGFSLPQFLEVAGYRFAAFTKERPTLANVPRLPARSNRGWLQS